MYRRPILTFLILLFMNTFWVGTSLAKSQACDLEYGDWYWENVQGQNQISCGFVGSQGDVIDVNCSGCIDLEMIAPDGKSLAISLQNSRAVLPSSGTYEVILTYDFGTYQEENYVPETCVDTSCGIDYATGEGGCLQECTGGNYQTQTYYYTGTPWLNINRVDNTTVRNVIYSSAAWDYVGQQWGNEQIYASTEGIGQPIRLTWSGQNFSADLSPDGSKIVFASDRDRNGSSTDYTHAEIYVMNADGTNQQRLTNSQADDGEPHWSPDGSKILFMSSQDGSMNNWEIFVMKADGSGLTQLTDNTVPDRLPVWSPDGQTIIFGRDLGNDYIIYTMNADGSQQSQLSNNPIQGSRPSFSPDGTHIVYNVSQGDVFSIFVMNADGSSPLRLTSGDRYNAIWSPNGRQILFASDDDENSGTQLYVMNADGSGAEKLTDDGDRYYSVTDWSSRGVVFSDAPATTVANLPPTLNPPVAGNNNGGSTVCASAGGQAKITVTIDELWIKDPEEADTTSIVGGDEAILYYAIGIKESDGADFGSNREFVKQWNADAYQGDRFTNFDPLSRTISCGEFVVVDIVAFEDDAPFGGSSLLGEEPIEFVLNASDIPNVAPRTEVVFSGRTGDGQYDYRVYYTLEVVPG